MPNTELSVERSYVLVREIARVNMHYFDEEQEQSFFFEDGEYSFAGSIREIVKLVLSGEERITPEGRWTTIVNRRTVSCSITAEIEAIVNALRVRKSNETLKDWYEWKLIPGKKGGELYYIVDLYASK
jgi:hypothetical protein